MFHKTSHYFTFSQYLYYLKYVKQSPLPGANAIKYMTRPSNPIQEYEDGQKLSAHTKSLGSSVELHRPMDEYAVSLYGRQEPFTADLPSSV